MLFRSILLFAFSLYAGSVLSLSLSGGVSSMSDRLGADIMVVPEGYDPHIDSILLSGKPSTFYLPRDVMELLREADVDGEIGIDKRADAAMFLQAVWHAARIRVF